MLIYVCCRHVLIPLGHQETSSTMRYLLSSMTSMAWEVVSKHWTQHIAADLKSHGLFELQVRNDWSLESGTIIERKLELCEKGVRNLSPKFHAKFAFSMPEKDQTWILQCLMVKCHTVPYQSELCKDGSYSSLKPKHKRDQSCKEKVKESQHTFHSWRTFQDTLKL